MANKNRFLMVSSDPRLPGGLRKVDPGDYTHMNLEEFMNAAMNDNLVVDEGIFYNIDSINKDIYEALKSFPIEVVYYKFDDQVIDQDPTYIKEKIINYKIQQKEAPAPQEPAPQQAQPQQSAPAPAPTQPVQQPVAPQPVQQPVPDKSLTDVGVDVLSDANSEQTVNLRELQEKGWAQLIGGETTNTIERQQNSKPGRIILFGSSKGGTGKTFTCLLTAYRYAKTHPTERIALADFDIIDGQIGVTIAKPSPTMLSYYKQYIAGNKEFKDLANCRVNNEHFGGNIDFYLAPEMDIPEVTNDNAFWKNVFELLIMNYDVVFFDSGIDYLGKAPISKLYKIADKILLTSNTSINSVSSVVKQLKTLDGQRKNGGVFKHEDGILDRLSVILTRVSPNSDINKVAMDSIKKYANIIAAFSNMDDQITRTQWYQEWEAWDGYPRICEYLDKIAE